jgi:hypothetical protein
MAIQEKQPYSHRVGSEHLWNGLVVWRVEQHLNQMEYPMRKWIVLAAAAAAVASFTPAPSMAQGVEVGVPGVGVRIGEPGYRDRDRQPYREGREFREREVRGGCRTVTVERDDGSVKRIRKCD